MTGMNSNTLWRESDDIFEDTLKPCQDVSDTLPLDCVEKTSMHLGGSGQDKVSHDHTDADSSSGESLFITQNPTPEAVRSVRRHHSKLRSDPASPREEEEEEDEESEDESAPSVSQSKTVSPSPVQSSKSRKKRIRRNLTRKRYCFPFLTRTCDASGRERKRGVTRLTLRQNASLSKFAVGCFFKSAKKLWEGKKNRDILASLPVIDLGKGETISPLSDEDETSNEEDIKVVEKRLFATSFKAKSSHTWYTPSSPERKDNSSVKGVKRPRRERADIAKKVTSKGPSDTREVTFSQTQSNPVKPSARVEDLSDVSIDSSSTSSELNSTQRSPVKHTQQAGDISPAATEPQAAVCHVDDLQVVQSEDECTTRQTCDPSFGFPDRLSDTVNESECDEVRKKKKKKKRKLEKEDSRGVDEGTELSSLQEGPEGQDADPCVNTEIPEVEETPSMSADKRAELSSPQASEEMRLSEKNRLTDSLCYDDQIMREEGRSVPLPQREDDINQRDTSQLKEKKKKRKKNKPADAAVIEDGLEKRSSENASAHSQQVDDSSSQLLSQTPDILFDEVAAVSKGPVDVEISAEHCASPPGNVRQEDDFGSTEPNVGMEEVAVFLERCKSPVQSDSRERKKKKRKRDKENDEGVVELPADAAARLSNDDHEFQIQKKKKKKKKKKLEKEDSRGIDEGTELSSLQEGPEGQDADPCVNTEIPEVEETPSMSADKQAELSSPQASEEMRLSEKNRMKDSLCYDDQIMREEGRSVPLPQHEDDINPRDTSQLKEKKKKRKKNKLADDAVIEDGLEKRSSENASAHSQQVDDSRSQFLSQTPEILFDEVAAVSKGPVGVKISAEHCASPPGNVRQEDDFGNTEPNVGMEEAAVFLESCKSPVQSDSRERKKKKRKRDQENDEGVVELPADAAARLPNDDHESQIQKKKKKKKRKKERDVTEEPEKEEALNLDLDRPMKSARQVEESGWSNPTLFSDNTEISHGTEESLNVRNSQQNTGSPIPQLEDVTVPRKKHRKKRRLTCNDTAEAGQDDTNDALTLTENALLSPKKKKRKKKKKRENTSEDTMAQSDDSVSVWEKEKEKKETGSFLADDTVEKDAQTHQESESSQNVGIFDGIRQKHKKKLAVSTSNIDTELVENVNLAGSDNMFREKKRKKKRKTPISQDAMVKDHENFEKPDKSQSSEPETTDTVVKRKKKHKKNQRESETPVSTGYSPTDETVVLTKKKKKKKSKHTGPAMEEDIPASVHVANVADLCETDLTVEAEHASESVKKKKKKKKKKCVDVVLPEGELLPESTEMKSHTWKKKKEMESKVTSISPVPSPPHSDHTNVKKRMKSRRKLHNPSRDFLD